jgi:hypothetical protein
MYVHVRNKVLRTTTSLLLKHARELLHKGTQKAKELILPRLLPRLCLWEWLRERRSNE